MNKGDLEVRLAQQLGIPLADAKAAVHEVFEGMSEALENKEKVSIVNFGSLTPTVRGARKARNPKTNQVVHVPEKTVVKWKSSERLKSL